MDELGRKSKELIDYLVLSGHLKKKYLIEAFKETPRHHFVMRGYQKYAYDDIALPLVNQATISQPSTVAVMLELLQPKKGDKVLEIGTGSGWEACILSKCVSDSGKVVTIEIDEDVAEFAKGNIEKLKPKNVKTVVGDGSAGYGPDAPYDKIIYTAATPEISMQALGQLSVHGRVVAPVGSLLLQTMKVVEKISLGKTVEGSHGTFQFIPLRGKLGF